jgi:hypothetical protein
MSGGTVHVTEPAVSDPSDSAGTEQRAKPDFVGVGAATVVQARVEPTNDEPLGSVSVTVPAEAAIVGALIGV